MTPRQLVLSTFVGSGEGDQSCVVLFKLAAMQTKDFSLIKAGESAISTVLIMTPGIYSVSAAMRFGCIDDQGPVSNAWGVTLNSFGQSERNIMNMGFSNLLAKAHLTEPTGREIGRQPAMTLSWVGFLGPNDQLRVESERPKPRLYAGNAEDRTCFFRLEKLIDQAG
jgi:hypothetical protein